MRVPSFDTATCCKRNCIPRVPTRRENSKTISSARTGTQRRFSHCHSRGSVNVRSLQMNTSRLLGTIAIAAALGLSPAFAKGGGAGGGNAGAGNSANNAGANPGHVFPGPSPSGSVPSPSGSALSSSGSSPSSVITTPATNVASPGTNGIAPSVASQRPGTNVNGRTLDPPPGQGAETHHILVTPTAATGTVSPHSGPTAAGTSDPRVFRKVPPQPRPSGQNPETQ